MNTTCTEDHLSRIKSYASFVAERTHRNPYFQNLLEFLRDSTASRHPCHIACLEFFTGQSLPNRRSLDLNSLASLLSNEVKKSLDLCGRILIFEDVSNVAVETLGALLDIDPLFFASHMDTSEIDIVKTRIQTAILPSTKRTQNFINLHYHRVVEFENLESEQTILRDMNVPRKVKILSQLKGINLGLARHCCSVLKTEGRDGSWLGLVLVDVPISNLYLRMRRENEHASIFMLQTRLFQGGFVDFLSGPSFSDDVDPESGPVRSSPLETLIYYWTVEQPQGFDVTSLTLFSLSYYPLRVIAAEWTIYLELMYHSIKQYEYSPDTILASLGKITILTADIHALQQWARRSIATMHKLRYVIDFLRCRMTKDKDMEYSAPIREDYEQIALSVDAYSRRLDAMVSVATSLIQAIDCRKSLTETTNISRLSHLALAFIPFTFVSGLFSMNNSIAPGARIFGLYFAVSIPLCIIVVLIVHPPTTTLADSAARIWGSRAIQKFVV